ncbi:MAG TPA: hypothetical protein P5305_22355 [Rubrivivax sp.]|nr:hypothetical protein [Rubrivivax sp.]
MSQSEKTAESSKILDAIRAKRERRTGHVGDIAGLEASLIADIEAFDLNEAERQARREQLASLGGMGSAALAFPEIVPSGAVRNLDSRRVGQGDDGQDPQSIVEGSSLLGQLRRQAAVRQRELHTELAERSASNNALEQTLKYMFFYLHDLVQQLNIVKPAIPRDYTAAGDVVFKDLVWQEGFADYRTQSQAAGAMVELVTLSYQLASPLTFTIERDGPAVERLRTALFDYGLQFSCKEFKNERSYVERAEFQVSGQVAVSARWKADFANGKLILESRNLERLGSNSQAIRPDAVDQALLDEFGRLVLGLPNRFRELARR